MSKQVNVFKDKGLVEIIYAGEVTPSDLAEDRKVGEKVCREAGVEKVLVDCLELRIPLSIIPLFDHGICLARSPVLGRIKHALIVPEAIVEDAHFFEAVLCNRGVKMRYFTTRSDALAWLNASPNKAIQSDN